MSSIFIYGTAWKEEKTEELTLMALNAGFCGIDTANQRKHYYEEAVGRGITKFLQGRSKTRDDLFIQTKFTFANGQDHRKPYDEKASFKIQLRQSFESSLNHLGVDYLDSYILHGPYLSSGISTIDLDVWCAMEELINEKKVKKIGISNVSFLQLVDLYNRVKIKPSYVQNRCYASRGWDKKVREFCLSNEIGYQGFSLLTANQNELAHPNVIALSEKYRKPIPSIVFRFCKQIGIIPLTGTTQENHMKEDLSIDDFELTSEEVNIFLN